MRLLYWLGDGIRLLLFGVFGYRRRVIESNLLRSFPDKSAAEIAAIRRQFEIIFIDTWMETIKLLTASDAWVRRRFICNTTVFEKLHAEGRSCQLMTGHFMNWELYNLYLPAQQPMRFIGIYTRLSSRAMERLFRRLRGRTGSVLIPTSAVQEGGLKPCLDRPYILAPGADQSPKKPMEAYWCRYLQQPTAFPTAPGRNAVKQQLTVVYTWLQRHKRGQYKCHVTWLNDGKPYQNEIALILDFKNALEATIGQQPANYLWSHRRWKHAWQPEYAGRWIDQRHPAPEL
jgi:KDO2-lipid IV(A) lauroyltransferase